MSFKFPLVSLALQVSDNAKICSNHFRSSDLITTLTGKRILAKNAVPFEPVKSSVLGARKIRKPSKDRAPVGTLKTRTSTTNSLNISLDLLTVFSTFHIGHVTKIRRNC